MTATLRASDSDDSIGWGGSLFGDNAQADRQPDDQTNNHIDDKDDVQDDGSDDNDDSDVDDDSDNYGKYLIEFQRLTRFVQDKVKQARLRQPSTDATVAQHDAYWYGWFDDIRRQTADVPDLDLDAPLTDPPIKKLCLAVVDESTQQSSCPCCADPDDFLAMRSFSGGPHLTGRDLLDWTAIVLHTRASSQFRDRNGVLKKLVFSQFKFKRSGGVFLCPGQEGLAIYIYYKDRDQSGQDADDIDGGDDGRGDDGTSAATEQIS